MELAGIGLVTAFVAGLISFLSPCVLPLVPGYVCYVSGQSLEALKTDRDGRARRAALGLSTLFVLGFSTVFVLLGASATAAGQLLLRYRYEANLVGGALVILFGLLMAGVIRPGWFLREWRFHGARPAAHPLAAYLLGLAFAFGWTPCIGPVLGAILAVSVVSMTVHEGMALLAVYSLGLGVPFLIVALFTGTFVARMKRLARLGRSLQVGAGVVMMIMGTAMITGQLTALSYWLLRTFPALAELG